MTRFLPVPRNILFQDASPTRANQHKMQYHKANDIPLRALYCSLLCRSQMLMKAFLRAVFFGAKDNNVSYTKKTQILVRTITRPLSAIKRAVALYTNMLPLAACTKASSGTERF